jgi:hypothetical protein
MVCAAPETCSTFDMTQTGKNAGGRRIGLPHRDTFPMCAAVCGRRKTALADRTAGREWVAIPATEIRSFQVSRCRQEFRGQADRIAQRSMPFALQVPPGE